MKKSVLYSVALGCALGVFSGATLFNTEAYATDGKMEHKASKKERAKKAIEELKRVAGGDIRRLDRLARIKDAFSNVFIFDVGMEKWRGKSPTGMAFSVFFDTYKDALPLMFGSSDLVQFGLRVSKEGRDPIERLAKNLYQQGKIGAYEWDADMLMVDVDNGSGVTEFHNRYRNLMGTEPKVNAIIFWMQGRTGFSSVMQSVLDKNDVALVDLLELRGRMHH